MSRSTFDLVAAGGGIAFTVFGLSTLVAAPPAPEIDATAAEIRSYLAENQTGFGVATILMALAVLSIALFFGHFHARIAESPARSTMAATFGVTAAGTVTLAMLGVIVQGIVGQQTGGLDDSTLLALHRAWIIVAFAGPPLLLSVALAIAGVVTVRDHLFPTWLGWVAAVSAMGGLVTALMNIGTSTRAPLALDFGSFALSCVFFTGVAVVTLAGRRHGSADRQQISVARASQ